MPNTLDFTTLYHCRTWDLQIFTVALSQTPIIWISLCIGPTATILPLENMEKKPGTGPRSQPTETPVTSLPATNTVNVELPSEAGNTYNKMLQLQAFKNGRNELTVIVCGP
ncbi:hypothetical protein ElyMa_001889400 [Elysia marginata]|uniref:Uncharacterized protein n=1 Tax=Elysia marginata TaxID=1093978 RepID=A0AAV4ERH7_9GAST|nr:hypothetical protein ElyMa_001889400 [Elysia marginata]